MSVALLLSWAAVATAAMLAALLLLATETVPHHSSWIPQPQWEPCCSNKVVGYLNYNVLKTIN